MSNVDINVDRRTDGLTDGRTDGKSDAYIAPCYKSVKNAEKVIKKYFRILKNPPAYFQAILKDHVKFQKDRSKTVGGVKGTRYLLPIDFCNIRTQKMSKFKTCKK